MGTGNGDGVGEGWTTAEGAADGAGRPVRGTVGWALGGATCLGLSALSVAVAVGLAPQPDAKASRQMISRAIYVGGSLRISSPHIEASAPPYDTITWLGSTKRYPSGREA